MNMASHRDKPLIDAVAAALKPLQHAIAEAVNAGLYPKLVAKTRCDIAHGNEIRLTDEFYIVVKRYQRVSNDD
ncbi:hypothetical protein LCGC14_1701800 [marine sediment metagenome]|uniref:Uncharacterized protein n=1 Tax=marine sediment metagenome TaxID=412755 RepID=A0A0F9I5D2_9ZZZZ